MHEPSTNDTSKFLHFLAVIMIQNYKNKSSLLYMFTKSYNSYVQIVMTELFIFLINLYISVNCISHTIIQNCVSGITCVAQFVTMVLTQSHAFLFPCVRQYAQYIRISCILEESISKFSASLS